MTPAVFIRGHGIARMICKTVRSTCAKSIVAFSETPDPIRRGECSIQKPYQCQRQRQNSRFWMSKLVGWSSAAEYRTAAPCALSRGPMTTQCISQRPTEPLMPGKSAGEMS